MEILEVTEEELTYMLKGLLAVTVNDDIESKRLQGLASSYASMLITRFKK